MFMHSLSDRVTLDRDNVFVHPMKYVTPNSGAGNSKVSSYDTSSADEDLPLYPSLLLNQRDINELETTLP
jgi:hypothetical protein